MIQHRNRDFFTRPYQGGGRDAPGYGRTSVPATRAGRVGQAMLIGFVLVGAVLALLVVLP